MQLVERARKFPDVPVCHPDEASQVARIRNYTIESAGRKYHIYRGDLHRHTDISGDGIGDGSLMDLHRWGGRHDAAFDFTMVEAISNIRAMTTNIAGKRNAAGQRPSRAYRAGRLHFDVWL